ncbi:hypothetical protein MYX65_10440, partial [Acidobacteria bacterium AH-259-L09]|nr:hypothetical protein [Acidobacteria bacterium AH-259-L09]
LGIPPPADGPAAAAKALSLVTGGAENVLMSIDAAAAPTQGERLRIQGVLAQSRAAVEAWLRGGCASMFTPHELDKLFDIWSGMWAAIDASVSQETRAQLQHLPIR